MKAILIISLSLGISSLAAAQPADSASTSDNRPEAPAPNLAPVGGPATPPTEMNPGYNTRDDGPSMSLTFSPLHLALPMLELTGEYRVNPKVGVAVIVGGGKVTPKNSPSSSIFELGASVRYYALGSFRKGIQIGAEVDYLHASADGTDVRGAGIAAGPFVGAKWISAFGLTLDGQIGAQYLQAQARSATTSASLSNTTVLLNLNIGYSF